MLPATIAPPPIDRKALLRARGRTLKKLAARLGVSLGHMSRVVAGERRSPRLERAIARELGLSVNEVFPERVERQEGAA